MTEQEFRKFIPDVAFDLIWSYDKNKIDKHGFVSFYYKKCKGHYNEVDGITIFNENGTIALDHFALDENAERKLKLTVKKYEQGFIKCSHCENYVALEDTFMSGFAGRVCKECKEFAEIIDTKGD